MRIFTRFFLVLHLFSCACFSVRGQLQSEVSATLEAAKEAREQEDNVEALRYYLQVLQEVRDDSTKQDTRRQVERQIGIIYYEEELYDKALSYLLPLLAYAPQDVRLMERVARAALVQQNYALARQQYKQLLSIYRREGNTKQTISTLERLMEVARQGTQFDEALDFEKEIMEVVSEEGDSAEIAMALKATSSLLLAISASEKSDKDPAYAAARKAFEDMLEMQFQRGFRVSNNAQVYLTIALIKQNQGNQRAALINFRSAARLFKQNGDSSRLAQTYRILAGMYFDDGKLTEARRYVTQAKEIAERNQLYKVLSNSYQLLSLIEQKEENYEGALSAYKQHLEIRDSLTFAQRLRQERLLREKQMLERSEERIRLLLASEEVRSLESERQRKELELLRKNQELQQAALEQQKLKEDQARQQLLLTRRQLESERQQSALEELRRRDDIREAELEAQRIQQEKQEKEMALLEEQKKNLEKDQKLKALQLKNAENRQKYFIGILILVAVILASGLFFFISTRRKNKLLDKQKSELSYQNARLDERNRQVMSSIRYAKTIQTAILPARERMKAELPPHFIFYRPRDIVSGDFYWFETVNDEQFLAVADCTGHGVPGAFMSMVGSAILTRIIQVQNHTSPAEALEHLKSTLYEILENSDTSNNDGMDIGIFRFSRPDVTGQQTLTFAGAKLGGLLVTKAGNAKRLKPTRYSIGARIRRGKTIQFKEQQVTFAPGDALYAFSDGIPDQNRHHTRRGIGTKKLQEWLAEHAHLPINEQEEAFLDFIEDLTDRVEQRDDMLLIGLKNERTHYE